MDYKEKVIALLNSQELSKEQKEKLELIFPELRESEDEKIRKDLIIYLRSILSNKKYGDKFIEGWIAWLEKQGENANFRNKIQIGDKVTRNEDCMLVNLSQLKRVAKPADKVEPKFKVDNWIVYKNDIWKVCNISLQNYYELLKINNEVSTRLIKDVDEDAHLWTIQDAKDGDVLTYSDSRNNVYLCIYKEYKNERVYDYCTLDKESFWEHGNWNYLASFNYAPATKEQLNTLLKAIVYAGYTFDFEKKELKKIKQKSIELDGNRSKELSLSLQIQAYLNTASDELYAKGKPLYSEKKIEYIHKCILMWQKLHHAYFYQKPVVWSKEDEKKIDSIIETIRIRKFENPQLAPVYEGDINWLKSLRPQSTWKPSDEQIEILDMVLSNESMDDNVANILRKLREQLKKLREE